MFCKQFLTVLLFLQFFFIFKNELIGVVEIIRDGASTSMDLKESNSKLYFGSRKAQLTFNGLRQHLLLGRWLRRRYVKGDVGRLFSDKKRADELKVYSSPRQRTIFSAAAHIMGLFPNSYTKIVYKNHEMKNDDTPPLKGFQMKEEYGREISINVLNYKENFFFGTMHCFYKETNKKVKDSIKYEKLIVIHEKEISEAAKEVLDKFALFFKIRKFSQKQKDYDDFQSNYELKNFSNVFLKKLMDFISMFHYHNFANYAISDSHIKTFNKTLLDKWYGIRINDSKELRLAVSAMFKEIVDFFELRINNENKEKMLIFSGHVTNIVDFLSNILEEKFLRKKIINAQDNLEDFNFLIPQPASSIILELHKENNNFYISLIYNGVNYNDLVFKIPIRLSKSKNKLNYEDFIKLLTSRIDNDYQKLICKH